jgi:hypothetical protein
MLAETQAQVLPSAPGSALSFARSATDGPGRGQMPASAVLPARCGAVGQHRRDTRGRAEAGPCPRLPSWSARRSGIADWGEDAGSARSEHDGRVAVGRYVGRTIEPQDRSPAAGDDLDHRMRSRLPREQA